MKTVTPVDGVDRREGVDVDGDHAAPCRHEPHLRFDRRRGLWCPGPATAAAMRIGCSVLTDIALVEPEQVQLAGVGARGARSRGPRASTVPLVRTG